MSPGAVVGSPGPAVAALLAAGSPIPSRSANRLSARRPRLVIVAAAPRYQVEIRDLKGVKHQLEVPGDRTILDVAIDKGLDVSYDCKLGVCMTCPAKLVAGTVDQSSGMLSPDVQAKGYALLCCAFPKTDIKIQIVEEDELLNEQLCA